MSRKSTQADKRAASILHEIYRPILRGYFAAFALYYIVMFPTHMFEYSGLNRVQMGSLALIAATIGLLGVWMLRKQTSPDRLSAVLLAMNISVVFNVLAALNINLQPEKLIYFIIMVVAFGIASVNLRQSLMSIALAFAAMAFFLPSMEPSTLSRFAFLGFAAAVASLAIAFIMRRAIMNIAHAKVEAEERLEEARIMGNQLREKSLSDSLTGLPNRRAFFGALSQARRSLSEARRMQGPSASANQRGAWLVLVDLDGFKAVNDIHGHLTGDALLQEVAARISLCVGENGHLSRMGGDEFNVILHTSEGEDEIRSRCESWLSALSEPYVIDGRHIRISASIGCKALEIGQTSRLQITQADYALMVAKKQGKNRAVIFNDDHALQAKVRHEIERALRHADLTQEITLVFQPQYDLHSQRIVRAETLARWDSPVIGKIEPKRFIRIAEESGLITGITLTVAEKAFAELQSWPEPVAISINLSSFDLMSDPTIDQLIALAQRYRIDARLVEFEVTETAMMADFDKANANLRKLTANGFTIALDDFGTGYSNFSYLRALPIQKLKVDRSFLENPSDPLSAKILSSLAGMSRILDLECLLEGVEDELDLLIAKRSGFNLIQGYYFGKPMTAAQLLKHMQPPPSSLASGAVSG